MQISGSVGPSFNSDGVGTQPFRQGRTGELNMTEVHGRYYEQCRRGNLFYARAIVTAPAGIASSNGVGGPLLWNGSNAIVAVPLAITFCQSVVSTVAAPIGLFLGAQATQPTSTTVIDSSGSCLVGGSAPAASVYRVGTLSVVPPNFFPLANVGTGSLTAGKDAPQWIDLGGCFTLPVGTYCAVGSSATLSTLAAQVGLIWEEVPV